MASRALMQTTLWLIVLGAVLFGTAGDWRWPQAWVFLAEVGISSLVVGVLAGSPRSGAAGVAAVAALSR